jgi:hypothetical protein
VDKKYFPLLIIIVLIIYFLPESPKASEVELNNKEKVYQFLKSAYETQISLSIKDRDMEDIVLLMDPYFTKAFQEKFFEVNLYEENGKFFTYGTDFGHLYIPFFEFTEYTKVVFEKKKIYIYEYFPQNHLGPVGYESHYEGILLEQIGNQWKVSEYLFDEIPDRIIKKGLEQT